jgi:hypothetical protein
MSHRVGTPWDGWLHVLPLPGLEIDGEGDWAANLARIGLAGTDTLTGENRVASVSQHGMEALKARVATYGDAPTQAALRSAHLNGGDNALVLLVAIGVVVLAFRVSQVLIALPESSEVQYLDVGDLLGRANLGPQLPWEYVGFAIILVGLGLIVLGLRMRRHRRSAAT